jgi:imidazolonepropionase-like amidohydrolase
MDAQANVHGMSRPPRNPLATLMLLSACASGASEPSDKAGSGGGEDSAADADTDAPADDTAAPIDDTGGGGDDTGDPPEPLPDGAIVLDQVRIVDVSGVREDAAVVLVADLIWDVLPAGGPFPGAAEVQALPGVTVLPGLIDAHVHLTLSGALSWVGPTLAENLEAQLAWGVVGVADLGGPESLVDVRRRLEEGSLRGPRLWATGPMLTAVGSHPCEAVVDEQMCRFVDGDGSAAVAELPGADGRKVALADAAFSPWPTPRLDLGDLADITAAAAGAGQPVVAHVDTLDDAQDAAAAGVDVLVHPVFGERVTDAAALPDLPMHTTLGAFLGPGALVSGDLLGDDLSATPAAVRDDWASVRADPGRLGVGWVEESADWAADALATVRLAHGAGRELVAGSDAGYLLVPHGLGLHRELEVLVDAGLSPVDALTAATDTPARLLGWDDMGQVAPGYRADLLLVDGRPDEDIRATRAILGVYQGGTLVSTGGAWASPDPSVCVDDRDCGAGEACDGIDHTCQPTCAPVWDSSGVCGAASACTPQDGLGAGTGVCHRLRTCDLLSQDCSPDWYGEACVPIDIDTAGCWPAGPRRVGQTCDPLLPDLRCGQGSYCSAFTATCIELCDADAPDTCSLGTCTRVYTGASPWFGACL